MVDKSKCYIFQQIEGFPMQCVAVASNEAAAKIKVKELRDNNKFEMTKYFCMKCIDY